MSAWTVIEHYEATGTVADITFSSIPQTYTDLVLKLSLRDNRSAAVVDIARLEFNGSASNYTYRQLDAGGSDSGSDARAGYTTATDATANTFASTTVYIPNYTSSTAKTRSVDSVYENNSATSFIALIAGLWNVTDAITSIKVSAFNGSFVQYSSATLYGITKGSSGGVTVS